MKFFVAATSLIMALFVVPQSVFALPASPSDLWDIDTGSAVTNNSAVITGSSYWSSSIDRMFGAVIAGTAEPSSTLFTDSPVGDRHWVEWQTSAAITLRSFNLVAAHDNSDDNRDITWRGFTDFYLYTGDGLSWTEIYHYATDPDGDLHYGGGVTYTDPDYLELAVDVTPVLSQNFRAEFVYGPEYVLKGSRIIELDGYDTFLDGTTGEDPGPDPVPEPSTILLLGSGLLGLSWYGRKRKKA